MKVVDLSGYSFTGKSAVYDLLSEFEGYKHHSKTFEFELLRISGGILDLENALVKNWSPVRSSEAIRKYMNLVKSFGGNKTLISRLTSIGFQYDSYFPMFTQKSKSYVESLIITSWVCEWPFALIELPLPNVLFKKIKRSLGFKNSFDFKVYLSRLSDDEFSEATKEYLHELFSYCMDVNEKAIVLNNAFEPFSPLRSHKFFSDPKSIVVDRDPRDIYMAALYQGAVGNSNVGKAVIGKSVKDYIVRFKAYRNNNNNNGKNILKINFENLVIDYNYSTKKIIHFLGEEKNVHVNPKRYFDPNKSINGIGLWKKTTGKVKQDIEVITSELKDFCIDI